MRYSAWLLALYLQLHHASAFYPIDLASKLASESGKKASTKRFLPLLAESPFFADDDGDSVTVAFSRRGVKDRRANTNTVINSTEPSLPDSAPLDQDPDDFSYFPVVKVGSAQKEMYMLIDSGSANTFMFGASCTSKSCLTHNTFGKADSKTLDVSTDKWSVVYGSGSVSGVLATDSWSLAGFDVTMEFGLASTASDQFLDYPMDGILGLGRPASNQMGTKTFMEVLADQNLLKSNLFGVNLQRAVDGATDGEINFGVIDTSKFSGTLTYSTLVGKNYWEIAADDASVDGAACGMTGRTAVFDTGTTFVVLPPSDASVLHGKIDGAILYGQYFNIPCKTDVELAFTFSGKSYPISPKDYVGSTNSSSGLCVSNILSHANATPSDGQWLIGDTFLKNVYTVFDVDGSRLGLAPRVAYGSTSSTSTKSSTKTSTTGSSSATGSSSSTSTDSPNPSSSTGSSTDGSSSTGSKSTTSASASATDANGNTSQGAASTVAVSRGTVAVVGWLAAFCLLY